ASARAGTRRCRRRWPASPPRQREWRCKKFRCKKRRRKKCRCSRGEKPCGDASQARGRRRQQGCEAKTRSGVQVQGRFAMKGARRKKPSPLSLLGGEGWVRGLRRNLLQG